MTDKVVDASTIAAVTFDELDRARAEAMLMGAKLFAPLLLDYEMASVCLKKIRNTPSEHRELLAAFNGFLALPITRVQADMDETIELALRKKISLYDATYLWLARSMNVELATLDGKLARAARP